MPKKKGNKKYTPRDETPVERVYVVTYTTNGTHPEQLERLDKLFAREIYNFAGRSATVERVIELCQWVGEPIVNDRDASAL